MNKPLTAMLPIALSECLTPTDLGEVLTAAEEEMSSPEDYMVGAVRERLMRRRMTQERADQQTIEQRAAALSGAAAQA